MLKYSPAMLRGAVLGALTMHVAMAYLDKIASMKVLPAKGTRPRRLELASDMAFEIVANYLVA